MRTDGDATLHGRIDCSPHRQWIAGMKSTGDVRRTDAVEHGQVIAHGPGPEGFTEIAIEIDRMHAAYSNRVRMVSDRRARRKRDPAGM